MNYTDAQILTTKALNMLESKSSEFNRDWQIVKYATTKHVKYNYQSKESAKPIYDEVIETLPNLFEEVETATVEEACATILDFFATIMALDRMADEALIFQSTKSKTTYMINIITVNTKYIGIYANQANNGHVPFVIICDDIKSTDNKWCSVGFAFDANEKIAQKGKLLDRNIFASSWSLSTTFGRRVANGNFKQIVSIIRDVLD